MTWTPSAVLFDLDHTLCRYRRPGSAVLAAAFDAIDVEPLFSVSAYYDRFETYLEQCETADELRRRCFSDLARETGEDPDVGHRLAEAYARERDGRNVELLPGAATTVETVANQFDVGLVTNGTPDLQREKLEAVGLMDPFDVIVYAGVDAPPKPDPEPFDLALTSLGTDPERAIHVGNSLESDVAGADAAGVRSVWIPHHDEPEDPAPEPDFRLDTIESLLDLPWMR